MRERPILFSGAMVRALLDGSKTQTRRVVKGRALDWLQPGMFTPEYVALRDSFLSPYGFTGDRLYVRETFFAYGRWETRFSAKKGRDEWHFVDMTLECDRIYQYAADGPEVPLQEQRGGIFPGWWKRPAIHMPRRASRTDLDVMDVRVERLKQISEGDAFAEGMRGNSNHSVVWHEPTKEHLLPAVVDEYATLWDELNAARGYGWDSNPWVWVVEFKRVAP